MISQNTKDTQKLAKELADNSKPGTVIALYGDLGTGKTTFTQAFAKALGVNTAVTSPTFLVSKSYSIDREDITKLYHLDLYRLNSKREIEEIGFNEMIHDSHGVVIIEWAERLGNLLPEKRIDIKLEYLGEDQRQITMEDYK